MKTRKNYRKFIALIFISCAIALPAFGQTEDVDEDSIYELDPFEVSPSETEGYVATTTMAGTRINTQLKDVGSAISVVTKQFMDDIAATDSTSLLQYTTNTEVGSIQGNFAGGQDGATVSSNFDNPNNSTRVRGLAAADNTRNFFLSDISWDGYNVERVDMQRGPNSILFGLGSPAGIINTTTKKAYFDNTGEIQLRNGQYGSFRASLDVNRMLIEDQLAIRIAAVDDTEKYQQKPAFEDDSRIYAHIRWEPEALNSGSMGFSLQAHYENGEIDANRPRQIPVGDNITPWFRPIFQNDADNAAWGTSGITDGVSWAPGGAYNLDGGVGQRSFATTQFHDNNASVPRDGVQRPSWAGGDLENQANNWYIPALGNFAQVYGGPIAFYDGSSPNPTAPLNITEYRTINGIGPDGNADGSIATPYARMGSISSYANIVQNITSFPGSAAYAFPYQSLGQYKNKVITDPTIFDFYNQLIDGANKFEYEDWDAKNVNLSTTFLDGDLGLEFVWDSQDHTNGRESLLSYNQNLYIDINETYTDGTPNPNVGRPFISDSGQGGNFIRNRTRDVTRATAFYQFDFNDINDESWITRLLGSHVLTGLYVEDKSENTNREYIRYRMDDSFLGSISNEPRVSYDLNIPNTTIYLGPSLLGFAGVGGSGANIPNPSVRVVMPSTSPLSYWDDTWSPAAGINPGDVWDNNGTESTQSENPANYVGWTTTQANVLTADIQGNLDPFTTRLEAGRLNVESEALVLQSFFWDGAIVGTYGWREDTADAWAHGARTLEDGSLLEDSSDPGLLLSGPAHNSLNGQIHSYSVAAHINELLPENWLPVNLSLYYNESSNFQPLAQRTDVFGTSLPPPSGDTRDVSALIATKDNRYSFKVTKYKTSVTYQSSNYVDGSWYLSSAIVRGLNWANRFEYKTTSGGAVGVSEGSNTYSPSEGQTQEEADALEASHIAGWRQLITDIQDLSQEVTGNPEAYFEAYGINYDNPGIDHDGVNSTGGPPGFSYTQDSVSQGYEYEFTAQPTDNWRISFNASKTLASRNNVGGEGMGRFIELVSDAMDGPAGDLRLWWGSPSSPTHKDEWNSIIRGNWELTKLQEGTNNPEVRKWRYNLVTNYDFTEGKLTGFNVGMGYRWQDDVVIGYRIENNEDGVPAFVLDDPYRAPSEDAIDLWLGYSKQLSDKINWRIQLNVQNVGDNNRLIPITTQPDGTPAGYRIAPSQLWRLTNTFSF